MTMKRIRQRLTMLPEKTAFLKNISHNRRLSWVLFAVLIAFCSVSLVHMPNLKYMEVDLADSGERLFYPAVNDSINTWHMPMAPVICAAVVYPLFSMHVSVVVKMLVAGICVLETFSLAAFLFSPLQGFVAGLVAVWLCHARYCDVEQLVYSSVILLLANIMALRFKSVKDKEALLGVATGMTVLVKTVLVPFPLLYMVLFRSGTGFAKRAVLLFCGIITVVLLWGFANFISSGHVVLLDMGRGESNLITGVLGISGTGEGDMRALAGLAPGSGVMLWAVKTVCLHPLRYLHGCAERLVMVFLFHPVLFLCAFLACWISHRRREIMEISALSAYFLVVHCMMTIEFRYLVPFWFIAAALACGIVGDIPLHEQTSRNSGPGWPVFKSCAAALSAIALLSMALLLEYPFIHKHGVDYAYIMRNSPDNIWLWSKYGDSFMYKNDMDNMVMVRKKIYEMNPNLGMSYEMALIIRNSPQDRVRLEEMLSVGKLDLLLAVLIKLEAGDIALARSLFARYTEEQYVIRWASGSYELGIQDRLRRVSLHRTAETMAFIIRQLPYARMCAIGARLESLGMDEHAMLDSYYSVHFSDLGVIEAQAGKTEDATRDLLKAIELDPHNISAYATLGSVYIGQKRADKLVPLYRRAIELNGDAQSPLLDMLKADYAAYSAGTAKQ